MVATHHSVERLVDQWIEEEIGPFLPQIVVDMAADALAEEEWC